MCKYCACTRKWHIFFHTKFYIPHFLNCASENMKLFSIVSSNYSLVLCLFPLFFFKLFSCIVSISTFFLVLCLFSSCSLFHFVKLRNLRFHLIFLTKKMSTIKLLHDLINFFYCDSNVGKRASQDMNMILSVSKIK